jgi:2-hydroxy-3-keto-5-methylthiopentenyl-1-phosphate phosphatase
MPSKSSPAVVVLCDFDGTATPHTVINELFERFADPAWQDLCDAWERREITTPQGLPLCFGHVKATRAELESFLGTIALDPAFPDLVELCRSKGHDFAVASDGLTWYIRYVLENHGIHDLTIYANEIEFEPHGFRLSFPWYDPVTPLRGTSKVAIIRRYQAKGAKVVFIGDGLTDIEAAPVADLVYAKDGLLAHCREQGIPALAFSTLRDVVDGWSEP